MKKAFALAVCLALCLTLCPAVMADVIIEPNDNFYASHANDCEYYNRGCFTNGGDGYVSVFSAPNAKRAAVLIPNGALFHIAWVYDKGTAAWGYIEYDRDTLEPNWRNAAAGWVRMSEMAPDYDSESFFAEHGDEISDGARSLSITPDKPAAVWKYPGSGILLMSVQSYSDEAETAEFGKLYVDSEGREWGYLSYFFGRVNGWICLSDPYSTSLEPDGNYRAPDLIPAASAQALEAAAADAVGPSPVLIASVAAVLLLAVALLIFMLRKKKT